MPIEKQLHVRYIGIDIILDGAPFIELRLELHRVDTVTGDTIQIVGNFGRVYKRITDLNPIPLNTMSDDDAIDNFELMGLVGTAALRWVAMEYNTVINAEGNVVIE